MRLGDSLVPLIICDCSLESPAKRRRLCYDRIAWEKCKTAKPAGDAVSKAEVNGTRLMSESEYLQLQSAGEFDTNSSSWLQTDGEVRERGRLLWRSTLRQSIYLLQWCRVILRRPRVQSCRNLVSLLRSIPGEYEQKYILWF